MFQFSPAERMFVLQALLLGKRVDGRANNQRRSISLECDVLDNLAGSSHLVIDHSKCEIYTGVKLKIGSSSQGKLDTQVFLELSSMRKLTKQESDTLTYLQQLLQEHFIQRQRHSFSKIVVPNSRRHFIEIHIECFLLSQPHLSLLEPIFLSIRKALLSTTLPRLECFYNEVTNQETVQLTNQTYKLDLSQVQGFVLVGWQEGKGLLGLTALQCQAIASTVLVVTKGDKVVSIEALTGLIGTQQIHRICKFVLQNRK